MTVRRTTYEVAQEIRAKFKQYKKKQGIQTLLADEYELPVWVVWKIIQNKTYTKPLKGKKKPKSPRTRLNEDQVREIRELAKIGLWSNKEIGKQYKVSGWNVGQIVAGNTWKDVE